MIPQSEISLIHYLSYRKETQILDILSKIFEYIHFSSIKNGFETDCYGKSPLDTALNGTYLEV